MRTLLLSAVCAAALLSQPIAARAQAAGDVIVAIAEDGGGDLDGIAKAALGGVTAAVDLRLNFFDDDTSAAFSRFHALASFLV